jgi:hypothetical protein
MRICRLAITACLTLLSVHALADVTYTYTGNDFSNAVPPYTTSNSVTGSFTVASPLGANLALQQTPYLSYSFSDGVETITDLNAYLPFLENIDVATDSNGNITNWSVTILSNNDPTFNHIYTENYHGSLDLIVTDLGDLLTPVSPGLASIGEGVNFSDPGTWTSNIAAPPPSATPEPSTFALLGTGLIGILTTLKRRPNPEPLPRS